MVTLKAFHCVILTRMKSQDNAPRVAAENARAFAARQKLSGREIARRLELSPIYVSRRLSGEVEFSETDILRFAQVLNVSAALLLHKASR